MKELQIAAAQELNKLEGMDKSPYIIAQVIGNDRRIAIFHRSRLMGDYYRESGKQLVKEHYGNLNNSFPYLKIDDSSEWSSAKITKIATDYSGVGLHDTYHLRKKSGNLPEGEFNEISKIADNIDYALENSLSELANIWIIIAVSKINNEAYLKAMEPLK